MRDLLAAALADRYGIERELGRGGMASVWLAHDLRLDRPVAIKVLHPELAAAIGVDRFVREIRLAARLQHPGIVPVLDAGTVPGPGGIVLPWYSMAYVAGESLRARLDREGQLPVEDALRIAEQVADALAAAHREGVVHRDIKPENLLLTGGRAQVADFGIAKALVETGGERLTSTGVAIGTPTYMSPEQSIADAVDARSDQYSLATVLYEMLTGEPPYAGPTAQAIIARRMAEPPRPIRTVRPGIPHAVEATVCRALDRVPADRFRDIETFAAALRAGTSSRAMPRTRWLVPALAVAAIAVAVVGWLYAGRASPPSADPQVAALYARGIRSYERRTPAGAAEAVQAFGEAIRRDSGSALAWAGLAQTWVRAHQRQFTFPGIAPDSMLRLAIAASERATSLDAKSAEAWATQAQVLRALDPTDHRPALAAVHRSLAIDSTQAPTWHLLAVTLADSGNLGGATEAWRRAVSLDPAYGQAIAFLALAHYWRRQYDSAAHWADSAVSADPSFLLGRTAVAQVALERGQFARARSAFDAGRRISTGIEVVNTLAGAALVEARRGNHAEAVRLLSEAESLATAYEPLAAHSSVFLSQAHAALGRADEALAILARYALRDDLHFQLHLRCDPPFDPLATDPRFLAMLAARRPAGGC